LLQSWRSARTNFIGVPPAAGTPNTATAPTVSALLRISAGNGSRFSVISWVL
jgi:hypothetical protein